MEAKSSASTTVLEFRAGRVLVDEETKQATPDPDKGLVQLGMRKSEVFVKFYRRGGGGSGDGGGGDACASGAGSEGVGGHGEHGKPIDEVYLRPGAAVWKKVSKAKGRVYALEFTDGDRCVPHAWATERFCMHSLPVSISTLTMRASRLRVAAGKRDTLTDTTT